MKLRAFLASTCIWIFLTWFGIYMKKDAFSPESPFVDFSFEADNYSSHTEEPQGDIPILVWWTGNLFPHFKETANIRCGHVSCYSTSDRKYLSDERTRGFMFYGTDFDPEDLPLPRRKHHEWAILHEESPMNLYMLSHTTFISLFNHTATFSRHSDYPITSHTIPDLKYLTGRKVIPLSVKNQLKKTENLAPVFYAQSHEGVPSDRDRYVKELMKYIEVDSVGTCLHNKDLPPDLSVAGESFEKDAFINYTSVYKFHLAFENAICDDYMTEKLMRPIHVGSIPIYKGSRLANDWMPNNKTIILVDDFSSPKELAEYIHYLDENDDEYEKYLEYRKIGESETNKMLLEHLKEREWGVNVRGKVDMFSGFECHVCKKVTERIENEKLCKVDADTKPMPPKMADRTHMGCQQPYPSLVDPDDIPKDDPWWTYDWISLYWSEFDKARAVRKMIEEGETNSKLFFEYLKQFIS